MSSTRWQAAERRTTGLLPLLILAATASGGAAQEREGTAADVVSGAVLGAYSGAAFGLIGGLVPCNRTLAGTRCARIATSAGGLTGLIGGALVGADDAGALGDRWAGAGYGLATGAVVGYVLKRVVRQYAWEDAAAAAAVGAAIGTSPKGAGIGVGVGAITGSMLWLLTDLELADAAGITLVGLAAGGLAGWFVRDPEDGSGGVGFTIPVQIRF